MTSKNIKTSPLTHKLFGIETEIALKNLKRNGNRYQEVVFGDISIGGLVTEPPLGINISEDPGDMRPIMSHSALDRFWGLYTGNLENVATSQTVYLYLKADDISLLQDELATFQEATSTRYYVNNIIEEQRSRRQMQMIIEVFIYGIKSLAYGLPISLGIMVILYRQLSGSFDFGLFIPIKGIVIVIIAVFVVVGTAMFYSGAKVKKQNIIDGLKDGNL